MEREKSSERTSRDLEDSLAFEITESPMKLEKNEEEDEETTEQTEKIPEKRCLKRKRILTISDKINILYKLEKGMSSGEISRQYGITRSAISKIKKRKLDYLSKTSNEVSMQQKNLRMTKNPVLEDITYAWFCQQICLGEPINGPILCEKALSLNEKMSGSPSFKASNGWLHRFKRRHGIKHLASSGDKDPIDTESPEQFVVDFKKYIRFHEYESRNIYNADETGLNWKSLPRKISTKKQRRANERKNRVTTMICANAAGTHKIPALVISNEKKYKCFGNVACLPVIYKNQENSLMDRPLFVDWYTNHFIPAVRREQEKTGNGGKVLLLLDNAPCHSSAPALNSIDEHFSVMYLPPNVTSILQPMNQGIVESMKHHYRKIMTIRLFSSRDNGIYEFIDNLTMKDCCEMIATSWQNVSPTILAKTWELLLPENLFIADINDANSSIVTTSELTSTFNEIDDFKLTESDVVAWLNEDNNDHGWAPLTDEQLIAEAIEPEIVNVSMSIKSEPNYDVKNDEHYTAVDALSAIDIVYKWYEKQRTCTFDDLMMLNKIRSTVMEKIIEEK